MKLKIHVALAALLGLIALLKRCQRAFPCISLVKQEAMMAGLRSSIARICTDPNAANLRAVWDVEAASCRLDFPGESGKMPLLRSLKLAPFHTDPQFSGRNDGLWCSKRAVGMLWR
ncbi:MAG: hypothetical protein WCS31_17275 [Verrucomicrobiae bacterium]